jgi:hypothetical protein
LTILNLFKVIVAASFICNCIVDGIVYSFGIFLDEFSKYFGTGTGTITWAGSLLSGVYMLVGINFLLSYSISNYSNF